MSRAEPPFTRRGFVRLLGAGAVGSMFAPAALARGMEARFDPDRVPTLAPRRTSPLVRLDSNENPRGPSRAALRAIADATGLAHRYPDDAATELRALVARQHGVTVDEVCLGCGSTDVLRAAVQAYTSPSRALVTVVPTYEAAAAEAKRVGAPVREVAVGADLRLDLAAMREAAAGAGLVYLCNPNNPTSTVHGRAAVEEFVARVLRDSPGCAILVDEAYHEFVADPGYATAIPLALANPRVIVARTFSKVHGLAGLRVGYAVGHASTIAAVAPWTLDIGVHGLGAAAALASLGDKGAAAHLATEQRLNAESREMALRFFRDAGYAPADSQANFVMVDLKRDVRAFRKACREQGVSIGRLFPPLLTHARVSIGTKDEMRQAIDVFKRVLTAS